MEVDGGSIFFMYHYTKGSRCLIRDVMMYFRLANENSSSSLITLDRTDHTDEELCFCINCPLIINVAQSSVGDNFGCCDWLIDVRGFN